MESLARRWELRQGIDQAMGELEPRHRERLAALFLEPEPASFAQIGQRLDLSAGSIGPIRALLKGIWDCFAARGF